MAVQELYEPRSVTGLPSASDLAAHPMFRGLPGDVLAHLASRAVPRTYRKRHHLFHVGDLATSVFFIKSGLVALTGLDEQGNVPVVMTFSSGEIFGQAATVLGIAHPWTATAVVDTEVLVIRKDTFDDLYRRFPGLALHIIRGLCGMLHRSQMAAIRLSLAPVDARVARFLLESASKGAGPDPAQFDLDLSHRDLALLLGTARETVTRVLTRLARAGLIAIAGHRVSILRPEALRHMAETSPRPQP